MNTTLQLKRTTTDLRSIPEIVFYQPVKRAVDVFGALVGLIVFGPLMIIIAIALAFQHGPVFFAHERLGKGGRKFRCLKFRTMAPDAEQRLNAVLKTDPDARREWEADHKLKCDPRVTPIGRFLRETSLDELPQFLNILRGEMSIVGPRPITQSEVDKYGDSFALYAQCKPGVTGLWQVSGRNNLSYEKRVELDSEYAKHHTFVEDVKIMLRTFGVVIFRIGAH